MQIVSLTTDYGTRDYYAAELKASILAKGNPIQIIDISHDVDRYDIVQAAFFVTNVTPTFPSGTIHAVAVHCHYSDDPELICFQRKGHWYVGPNNGIFSLAFDDIPDDSVFHIQMPEEEQVPVNRLIAYVIENLCDGNPMETIAPPAAQYVRKLVIKPVITAGQIRATIIHIDHFENVIVNLKKEEFERVCHGRPFEIYYKPNEPITYLSNSYGDVGVGEALAFFNAAGYLEIALNMDKASSMLNLHKNETIQINFRS